MVKWYDRGGIYDIEGSVNTTDAKYAYWNKTAGFEKFLTSVMRSAVDPKGNYLFNMAYVAFEDSGHMWGVQRNSATNKLVVAARDKTVERLGEVCYQKWFLTPDDTRDHNNILTGFDPPNCSYDPRARIWYERGKQFATADLSVKSVWSDIETCLGGEVCITATSPIWMKDSNGKSKFMGLTVDLRLSTLSAYLAANVPAEFAGHWNTFVFELSVPETNTTYQEFFMVASASVNGTTVLSSCM